MRLLNVLFIFYLFIAAGCSSLPFDDSYSGVKNTDEDKPGSGNTTQVPFYAGKYDGDGDGITAEYDYDDSSVSYPEPILMNNEQGSQVQNRYTSYFWDSVSPLNNNLNKALTIEVPQGNNTPVALYRGYFKFFESQLYYSSDNNNWNYSVNQYKDLSTLNTISTQLGDGYFNNYTSTYDPKFLFHTNQPAETGGSFSILYNKSLLSNVPSNTLAKIMDTIGTAFQAGYYGGNFTEMMNRLGSKYYLHDVPGLLADIRDYFPQGFFAEMYRKETGGPKSYDITLKIDNNNHIPGRMKGAFYYGDNISVSFTCNGAHQYEIFNKMKWEVIKLGIKKQLLPADQWTVWNYNKLLDQVEYEIIPKESGYLSIDSSLISSAFYKRLVFLHAYFPGSYFDDLGPMVYTNRDGETNFQWCQETNRVYYPRMDMLVLLPLIDKGPRFSTIGTTYNGIIRQGEPLTIKAEDSFFNIKAKYFAPYALKTTYFTNQDKTSLLSIPMLDGGRADIEVAVERGADFMPQKAKLTFFPMAPYVHVNNVSSLPQYYVMGDKINIDTGSSLSQALLKDTTGPVFYLDYGVSNIIIAGGVTNYSRVKEMVLTNVTLNKSPFLIKAGMRQVVSYDYGSVAMTNWVLTNMSIAPVKPAFVITVDPPFFTNAQLAKFNYTLTASNTQYEGKFTNRTVTWFVSTNNVDIATGTTLFGSGSNFQYTFQTNGVYSVVASLNYNGIDYSYTNRITIGNYTPAITLVQVNGQNFGISNITSLESNRTYQLSFISGNVIRLEAIMSNNLTLSSNIWWNIKSVSNTSLIQNIVTNTPILSFTVNRPSHPEWSEGGSSTQAPPLCFEINSYYIENNNITNYFGITIMQEEKSTLRQEYYNHDITIVDYLDITNNVSNTYFTFNELNQGKYLNCAVLKSTLLINLDVIRNHFNRSIHLNSCYRNPEWNEELTNLGYAPSKTSIHQYGGAVDIRVDDLDGDGSINSSVTNDPGGDWGSVRDDWFLLANYGRSLSAWVEPYEINHMWGYVHLSW